jgi:5-methylcytosine-specific restriction endonuclease McrA
MTQPEYPPEFLALLAAVKGKRSRVVVEHILKNGFITTEELENIYGYSHPPRAIRDVREQGIPLETFSVKNAEGRTIAAYRFADFDKTILGRIGGRTTITKAFKNQLLETADSKCSICLSPFESRYLQVDHRVPYEVAGDVMDRLPEDYMLLCGACNRAKSWSCEHCRNWLEAKNPEVCKTCYWAQPEQYEHIAMRSIRRLDVTWTENEIPDYEQLKATALDENETLPDYVKKILKSHFESH